MWNESYGIVGLALDDALYSGDTDELSVTRGGPAVDGRECAVHRNGADAHTEDIRRRQRHNSLLLSVSAGVSDFRFLLLDRPLHLLLDPLVRLRQTFLQRNGGCPVEDLAQ